MRCILRNETHPYFNLAAEEYALHHFPDNCFMLWRNTPSIIVGKHQNTLAEINLEYVKSQKLPVIRRISGGGTVFHDLGNLNFTFIKNGKTGHLVDFKKYTQPIIEVLKNIGIKAQFEGHNDLRVNGLKISGNAEHVYKNRVLHHGTLLFSASLGNLYKALKINPDKYQDKAVKSIRSVVTNIQSHLPKEHQNMQVMDFAQRILIHVLNTHPEAYQYSFSTKDIQAIDQLKNEKYQAWEWNYGYSPKYALTNTIQIKELNHTLRLSVKKGLIDKLFIEGLTAEEQSPIQHVLIGQRHQKAHLIEVLDNFNTHNHLLNISTHKLIDALF